MESGLSRLSFVMLALLGSLSCATRVDTPTEPRPIPQNLDIQGHRGARGLLPENSIAAFKKALALQVTTLELDIQTTKDGVLAVYHDQHLDSKRCIYDDGRKVPKKLLEELLYGDLASIDCGRLRHPRFPEQQRVPGTRIPRLEQVLILARDAHYPVHLSIEIKWQNRKDGMSVQDVAARLVTLIKQYGLKERTIVQSFSPPALLAVHDLDPDIPTAILVRNRQRYDRIVAESRATILSPRHDRLRSQDVKRFQARNIRVIPWTANESAEICRLIRWGVDGIISDYPNRVIDLHNDKSCGN
ncbi:MAG: glycerophosphodiester phosphodiesterase family protein [Acidiferrobacterales bacterium]